MKTIIANASIPLIMSLYDSNAVEGSPPLVYPAGIHPLVLRFS
ncbi:MAG: hypothetical protein ACPGC9_00695 [Cytophagales bacterium]